MLCQVQPIVLRSGLATRRISPMGPGSQGPRVAVPVSQGGPGEGHQTRVSRNRGVPFGAPPGSRGGLGRPPTTPQRGPRHH